MAKKVSINSLRNLRQYKDWIKVDELQKDIIGTLAKYGEKIINMAYATRTFENRTGNLHDSYVSAVFVNGNLQKDTIRYVGEEMSNVAREYDMMSNGDPEQRNGREEAKLFLSKFQFAEGRPNGIVLVVAATMFYAGILESPKFNYLVISQVNQEMEAIKAAGLQLNKMNATLPNIYINSPKTYRDGGMGRMSIKL